MAVAVELPQDRIADICQRYGVRRMSVFGSAVRGDFGPDSDVDVLVEFESGRTPGLRFFALQQELTEVVGRKVDLNTPNGLRRLIRERALSDAEVVYNAECALGR